MHTSDGTQVMSEEDRREIRDAATDRNTFVSEALRSLEQLNHSRSTSPEAVVGLLRQESFTTIPSKFRQRSTASGKGSSSNPSKSPMREITYNDEYERRLAERTAPGVFRVPVERALPISYEAQSDLRYVTGERRRSSLHLESGYAPLFTKSTSCGREMTPDEQARLEFLQTKEDNPRREAERRLQERRAFERKSDPNFKKRYNEPKVMPNLHRKESPNFVPQCVDVPTVASEVRFEGNEERMQAAKANITAKQWRI